MPRAKPALTPEQVRLAAERRMGLWRHWTQVASLGGVSEDALEARSLLEELRSIAPARPRQPSPDLDDVGRELEEALATLVARRPGARSKLWTHRMLMVEAMIRAEAREWSFHRAAAEVVAEARTADRAAAEAEEVWGMASPPRCGAQDEAVKRLEKLRRRFKAVEKGRWQYGLEVEAERAVFAEEHGGTIGPMTGEKLPDK